MEKETAPNEAKTTEKWKLVLKVLFLICPAIIFSICEVSITQVGLDHFFSSGLWVAVIVPLLVVIPIIVLYVFKELSKKKNITLIYISIQFLFHIVGIILSFLYLGYGIAFGMSTSQSIYIPLLFILFIATAIFFTIEAIKNIKNLKNKENSNEKV